MPLSVKSSATGFEPAFPYVDTKNDRRACLLACIAIVSSTSLEDVFKNAHALGMPKSGTYYQRLDEQFWQAWVRPSAEFSQFGKRFRSQRIYQTFVLPWSNTMKFRRLDVLSFAIGPKRVMMLRSLLT